MNKSEDKFKIKASDLSFKIALLMLLLIQFILEVFVVLLGSIKTHTEKVPDSISRVA